MGHHLLNFFFYNVLNLCMLSSLTVSSVVLFSVFLCAVNGLNYEILRSLGKKIVDGEPCFKSNLHDS